MDSSQDPARHQQGPKLYEIRVQGRLDSRWSDWVDDLTFTHEADGTTTLNGVLPDQAALHGVLSRMRDLGVAIISVQRIEFGDQRELQGEPRC